MPKTQQTTWAIGLSSVAVVVATVAVALVTSSGERPEARTDPPAPQVFHDVITVASLLDTVPIVADPASTEEWPDQARWHGIVLPASSERGCGVETTALAAALDDVTFAPGSDCIVAQGRLHDPYTGSTIEYDSASGVGSVSVDHIYPLNTAWVLGASTWTPEQQSSFVNDVQRNVIVAVASAVGDRANRALAHWLPPSQNFACTFAAKYLRVAQAYDLPITRGDAAAATQACGLGADARSGPADARSTN